MNVYFVNIKFRLYVNSVYTFSGLIEVSKVSIESINNAILKFVKNKMDDLVDYNENLLNIENIEILDIRKL